MLKKIQSASSATSEASTNSVKWYTTPTDTAQDAGDVTFNTLGFTGSGGTFTLYLDDEKTGSKSYHLYIKNLTASLVLTTNKGATDLTLISGSYIANIFVDEDGNIINQGMTAVDSVISGNTQPVTSDAVYDAISSAIGTNPNVTNATGVLPIAHGGTGKTTAQDACNELINGLSTESSTPVDADYYVSQYVNGGTTTKTFHRRPMSALWEYIKGKISSVLGLTSTDYGGKASTAGTADNADTVDGYHANSFFYQKGYVPANTDTFDSYMNTHGAWVDQYNLPGWWGSLFSFYAGGSQSGLLFRILGGNSGANQVQMNYSIDSNEFGMNWATIINSENIGSQTVNKATTAETANKIRTSAPSSPSNGDIWIS